eukprot:15461453-Alexandrium_andersonii.AAC.1
MAAVAAFLSQAAAHSTCGSRLVQQCKVKDLPVFHQDCPGEFAGYQAAGACSCHPLESAH